MISTQVKLQYFAFGLSIESDIPLPELTPSLESNRLCDVQIRMDRFLKNGFDAQPYDFLADGSTITVKLPDAGVFRIQDGNRIIVSPYSGADEDLIRLYVLGTCFGIILLQRLIYPLHGSAIAINGKAYAIVGHSGAGKSTLASVFIERGFRILSDDVIAVRMDEEQSRPYVYPSYPQQKLWQNSLTAFGRSHEALRSIYGREDKYCIPITDSFHDAPLPLAGVFELTKVQTQEALISVAPVSKLQRLPLLLQHTYRYQLIERMNMMRWHFERTAMLASSMMIYQLRRSEAVFTAQELADLILNTIAAEE